MSKTEKGFEANNRETLTHLQKVTGEKFEQLTLSTNPPKAFLYVWNWFIEIYNNSPEFSFQELKAWSDFRGVKLTPIELNLLLTFNKKACQPK